jgi:3-phosphoshikimate 1-carboxyvinyltransferase
MARFAIQVEQESWSRFIIPGDQTYISQSDIQIEGDASSASYFLAAGALAGGPVRVEGVGAASIQGDIKFAEALRLMGANVSMGSNWIEASAQLPLQAIDADFNHMPDAAMTLAVVALAAKGVSTLRNIGSWRVKESDRLSAMASELRKVGAIIEEGSDFLRITPPETLKAHATIETYEDHRIAMCFALLPLLGTHISIKNPQCVAKTFPNYFEILAGLRGQK